MHKKLPTCANHVMFFTRITRTKRKGVTWQKGINVQCNQRDKGKITSRQHKIQVLTTSKTDCDSFHSMNAEVVWNPFHALWHVDSLYVKR